MLYGRMIAPLDVIEFDDPASSAGAAGMNARLNVPIFSGFRQFSFYILPLEKQCLGALFDQRFREAEQHL